MTRPPHAASPPVHICVCICTYKRPEQLRRLLTATLAQETEGRFTHSIVVVDNDHLESARQVVTRIAATAPLAISYDVEPQQSIALARNRTFEMATGDFLAMIDDDENPASDWLLRLLEAIELYEADGVLGPVIPHFVSPPPAWVAEAGCFGTPLLPSGTLLRWNQTRAGNVLLRRRVLAMPCKPFRPEYASGGEDVDFFRRMIASGSRFVWCAEGKVFEDVPIERCRRRYLLKRALNRGRAPYNHGWPVLTSLVAVPVYLLVLPIILVFRSRRLMRYLISLCDHLGRILAFVGGRQWDKLLPPGRP